MQSSDYNKLGKDKKYCEASLKKKKSEEDQNIIVKDIVEDGELKGHQTPKEAILIWIGNCSCFSWN